MRVTGRFDADVAAPVLLPCRQHDAVIFVLDNDRVSHRGFRLAIGPFYDDLS